MNLSLANFVISSKGNNLFFFEQYMCMVPIASIIYYTDGLFLFNSKPL